MEQKYLTIPGFEKLTPQQCFDMAARHIMTTRAKCTNGSGSCQYRGIGCAASVFLTEKGKEIGDQIDGASWDVLEMEGLVPDTNQNLIHSLQKAHDDALDQAFMECWLKAMKIIAQNYNLNTHQLTK